MLSIKKLTKVYKGTQTKKYEARNIAQRVAPDIWAVWDEYIRIRCGGAGS